MNKCNTCDNDNIVNKVLNVSYCLNCNKWAENYNCPLLPKELFEIIKHPQPPLSKKEKEWVMKVAKKLDDRR